MTRKPNRLVNPEELLPVNPESPLADDVESADFPAVQSGESFDPIDVPVMDVTTAPPVFQVEDMPDAVVSIDTKKTEERRKFVPKAGPPTLSEWQDFIGRIVLRTLTEFYLDSALRGIRDLLTDREMEEIRLTKDELKELAAPFASLVHKSKFAHKRGRQIVEASNSIEALFALLIWTRRVNRITKKYRAPKNAKKVNVDGNSGLNAEQGNAEGFGGYFGVYNPGTG